METRLALIINTQRYLKNVGLLLIGQQPRTSLNKCRKDIRRGISILNDAGNSFTTIRAMAETACQLVVIDKIMEEMI